MAARYEPAAAEAEVGGDWYDVIPTPAGGVGLVMGDVAGKGLAAASMVGRLRSALRAYALEGHEPGARHRAAQPARLDGGPTTARWRRCIYMVVDPAEGRVDWVNAGHPPPLLVAGDRTAALPRGRHLGAARRAALPELREVYGRDGAGQHDRALHGRPDRAAGRAHRRGHGEARRGACRRRPTIPSALCDHLLADAGAEGGATDDVAILALRNLPVTDRFEAEFPTEPEALAQMRELLRRWLRHAGGSRQEIAEITTACGEAATNAIEHAGVGAAPFEVGGRIVDGARSSSRSATTASGAQPREGDQGRGLSLMRALMDTVEVTPSPEGTTVRLRRRLDSESEGLE